MLCVLRGGSDYFSINIELNLVPGAVADANGAGVQVTIQVIEFLLPRGDFSEHRIEHSQFRLGAPRGMQQPGQETFSLFDVTQFQHGANGERGVA